MVGTGDNECAMKVQIWRRNPNMSLSLAFAATCGDGEIERRP
jgi:hypothetical protein